MGFKSLELSAAVVSFLFFLIKEIATVCVQSETIKYSKTHTQTPPLQILHFHASSAETRRFLYTGHCIGVKGV